MNTKNNIAYEVNRFKFLGLAVIAVHKNSDFKNNFWNKIMYEWMMWSKCQVFCVSREYQGSIKLLKLFFWRR